MGADLADQVRQQLDGSFIHVVRVLDLDQLRLGHRCREEARDRFVHFRAPVRLRQHFNFGRCSDFETEGDCNQRQPRRQIGRYSFDFRAKALGDFHLGIIATELHVFAQQFAPHRVWGGSGIGFASGVLLVEADRRVAQRLEQARLADARIACDFDQAARTRTCAGESFADSAQLGIAARKRQTLRRYLSRFRALRAPDRPGMNRLGLTLDRKRIEASRFEHGVRPIEHV